MWICTRCQTANKEGHRLCLQCSAPRNARRFGASARLDAPSLQSAPQPPAASAPTPMPSPPAPDQMPAVKRSAGGRRGGAFTRLTGRLLVFLLPAVTLFLLVCQRSEFAGWVAMLLAQPDKETPNLLLLALLLILAVLALLLSLVPGLVLLALARLLRRSSDELASSGQ